MDKHFPVGEKTEDYGYQIPDSLFLGNRNAVSNTEDNVVREELRK